MLLLLLLLLLLRLKYYSETEFIDHSGYYYGPSAGPIDQTGVYHPHSHHPHHHLSQQPPPPTTATAATLRRSRYYSPSYTTYPPSTMYPMPMGTVYPISNQQMEEERKAAKKRHINKRYPILLRAALKFAQLALAAAILGLVLGPMRSYTFHDFVTRTGTEYQGAVVGIVSVFGILTLILLVTLFCGYATAAWRKLDAFVTGAGWFLYILVAFLEAYFAACYPPTGKNHPEVCHRAEWIIACVSFIFF
uniref:MARVEL domain-containing protein n=1 Tax=Panagrolaimus superbus TaxID=310955 RepID=A0A914Z162_9BILA